MDKLFSINELKFRITSRAENETRAGGSSIQLLFGFVQWHSPRKIILGEMQFHHNFEKMLKLNK